MHSAKDSDSCYLFKYWYSEFLSAHQISGFFSRLASKRKAVEETSQAVGREAVDSNISGMSKQLAEVMM
jgi:hypothetical protein